MPGPKNVTECKKLARHDRDEFKEIAVVLQNINPPLIFTNHPMMTREEHEVPPKGIALIYLAMTTAKGWPFLSKKVVVKLILALPVIEALKLIKLRWVCL